ncbi:MAG: hypothetical protein JW861_13780, partial [Bacteroidales bacterium]|nr:hypothetical protein [Bacteroidales bacterium]
MKRFTRIMTLIGALVLSIGMVAAQGGFNDKSPEANTNPVTSEALFDLQFQYPCGVGGGEAGIECDGSFFYTTKWNGTDVFYKYQLDGTYLNEFTVPGTGGIRDLAFDGTYMYGSEATNTVREMDFTGGTLISSFSAPTAVRAIAWNEDDQVFYANNWSTNIIPFNKSGVQQRTSWTPGPIGASYYGFAYDNYSSGAPYLWGYAQTGSTNNELVQMQLPGGAETGVYFDVGSIIPPTTGIAGGLCIDNAFVSGYYTLAGNMQNDFLWGLELCEDGGGPGALYFND